MRSSLTSGAQWGKSHTIRSSRGPGLLPVCFPPSEPRRDKESWQLILLMLQSVHSWAARGRGCEEGLQMEWHQRQVRGRKLPRRKPRPLRNTLGKSGLGAASWPRNVRRYATEIQISRL